MAALGVERRRTGYGCPVGEEDRRDDRRASVLVLRALQIGDLLVAVPALRALRRAHPQHRLVLATPAALAPLVARIGGIDALLPTSDPTAIGWSGPAPDVAVNLHGTGPQSHRALEAVGAGRRIGFRCAESGHGWDGPGWDDVAAAHPHERARWCALLQAVGIPADPDDLRLHAPSHHSGPQQGPAQPNRTEPNRTAPNRTAPNRPSRAPVVVHPGAAFGAKRWPAGRFAAVAAALDGPGSPVVVTGSAAERELAEEVAVRAGLPAERVVAGRTDLGQLCDLVAGAALVVSGDTGIAHLASAHATPSVVLFGPVDPAQWGPPTGGPHVALAHPARRRGARFADKPDPALLAIGVDEVLAAAAALRDRSAAGAGRSHPRTDIA
jgi:ADP-heptose:LPS heptosyltransferase